MTPVGKTIRHRGNVLDHYLTYSFVDGLFVTVRAEDKAGKVLEEFQFQLDQSTVEAWLRQVAVGFVRSRFFRRSGGVGKWSLFPR